MNIKGMFRTPSLYVFNQTDAAPQTLLQKKMELREHLKGCSKNAKFLWSSPWWSLWSSSKHAINIDKKAKQSGKFRRYQA
jgi:hypothetical protein